MSNVIQASGKEAFLGAILTSGDIRVVLLSAAYTYSSAHANLSDVPGGDRVFTTPALTGKSVTGGVFDANDVSCGALSGSQITQFFIFLHTGVESTSTLLFYFDTGIGLPLTPDGISPVFLEWDNGTNRIARL